MFRSIRWRLVVSYALLTLLAVSLVGVLALSLMQRYLERQEQDYLTANAEAVARQALPLMTPEVRAADLGELARTASFLGQVQVRVLTPEGRVIADSGSPTGVEAMLWIAGPEEIGFASSLLPHADSIVVVPFSRFASDEIALGDSFVPVLEGLPPGAEVMVVHRTGRPWGSRFAFGAWHRSPEGLPTLPVTPGQLAQVNLDAYAVPRSERVITVPIGELGQPFGYVELSGGVDVAAEALTTARQAFLYAAAGATLLAGVVGLLIGRGLTAPLRGLAHAAEQMSAGDLSIRAPVRGKDEIGQLARRFNQMAERLEASFAELAAERDSLRRFIADASHELRTPITALRSFNELLQDTASDDPAARAEFLAESQTQLERLAWITDNLLDLSRLEAGLVDLDMATHDVGELIKAAVAAFRATALGKDIALSVSEPEPPAEVRCDRARVELALSNLIDNAIKFTSPGGRVEVGAEQDREGVYLWVEDNGPGISAEEQGRVFERFYRGASAGAEGSGLGLAIVRGIVQAHGGRVAFTSEIGEGSRFVIALPPPVLDAD